MLLLIRSNSISSDPRVEKYLSFLMKEKIPFHVLGWDRTNQLLKSDNITYYKKNCGYNMGGLKAAYYRVGWMWFCLRFLLTNKKKYDTIHGCDLDSVFPAVVYKILSFKCNVNIVFDVFDWFSATLYNQSVFIRKIFSFMEYLSVKYADSIIICEKERQEQIPYNICNKLFVLPNIPYFSNDRSFLFLDSKYSFTQEKLTISYVGGFYKERFLDELLDLAERGDINLLIAGYGDRNLESRCEKLSVLPNIYYAGKVDYKEGLNIMYNSDVIYAMYCTSNPNHIYAAPNKYYEAMFLGKPIISNIGTIVGDKIKKNHMGYVIHEDIKDLILLCNTVTTDDLKLKGQNAYKLWDNQYKNYTSNFMEREYSSLIKLS